MLKKSLGIILAMCLLVSSCLCGILSVTAAETNHGLYIDTTACTDHSTIVLTQAVYEQPVGNYTVEFDYYTEESGAKSRLNIRTSGNVGESAADLYSTTFKKDEWLTYSSTIQNQKNTAIMIKLYVWPGFKGYIDNIVLKDSNGAVSLELDFDAKTTTVHEIGQDKNATAEVKECPEKFDASKNHGLYINTTACSSWSTVVLDKAIYNQPVGNYTIEFDYYAEEFAANSRISARTSGNVGEYNGAVDATKFESGEWLHHSTTIANQNTAIQIKIYFWPGFKGYIDNIVLKDSNGAVAMTLDFDENTTTVGALGGAANLVAKIDECPKSDSAGEANKGIYIDTTACTGRSAFVLEQAIYDQHVGNYTIEFDYYVLEATSASVLQTATAGNVGNYKTPELKQFTKNEWAKYSYTVANQNTAIQLRFYAWPGLKCYIDNVVLKDSNGVVVMEFDFEEKTTNIINSDNPAMVAKIDECPKSAGAEEDDSVVAYKLTIDAAGEFFRSTNNQASSSYAFSFDYYLASGKVDVDLYSNPNIRKASLVSGVSSYAYNGDIADKSFLLTAVDGPAELYIWNVKVVVDGTEVEFANYVDRTTCEVEQTTYDKITLPEVKNKGLYIDTTGCTSHTCIVLEQAIYDQPVGEYAVEFKYYTLESAANSQLNVRTGGNVGECAAPLYEKNFAKNAWLTYSSTIQNNNTALQINFYVWPGFKGYIDNIVLKKPDGSVAMELDFDAKTTGVLDIRNDTNVVAEVKECPDVVEGGGNQGGNQGGSQGGSQETLTGGPYMLKQENYKFSEKLGSVLTYQAFHQHVGIHRNGKEIKPSTKYIFSFEYYCDPGENGTGVNSATAQVKTLHTGHNSTFPNPNMNMIYNKETGKYASVLLQNVGRNHFEIEFETLPEQTDIIVGLQSGWDGDAYYWDFKLVEKNGNGENLLERTEFMGTFLQNTEDYNANVNHLLWKIGSDSADGNGTYSFVEFNEAMANLAIGETLPEEGEEEGEDEGPQINIQDPNENVDIDLDNDNDNNEEEKDGLPVWVIVIIAVGGGVLLIGGGVLAFLLIKKAKK